MPLTSSLMSTRQVETAQSTDAPPAAGRSLSSYAGAALFAPTRLLFRAMVRLGSTPLDDEIGNVEAVASPSDLGAAYRGKRAIVVGGTKSIGATIVTTMQSAGAKVTVVARSAVATDTTDAFAADLSTVAGCEKLIDDIAAAGVAPWDYLVFTVGAWPDFSQPYTSDGVEKVVALDLLARHLVLDGLAAHGLLASGARVLNVLASAQHVPLQTEESVKARVEAKTPPATLPYALFPVGIAADAWLQDAAARHPSLTLVGMFPGIVASTQLPLCTFPSWMMPALTAAMLPVASSDADAGLAHATVLASPNVARKRVSYFNYMLEGRRAHELAYSPTLGAWISAHLDGIAAASRAAR